MRMRLKLSQWIAIGLVAGFSMTGVAHEAPVVDIQQQSETPTAVSTQADASTGGSWQPVSSDSGNATGNNGNNSGWQPVNNTSSGGAPSSHAASTSTSASEQATSTPSVSSGSADKRIERLEQQISNYNQMNLPQQVSDLQQKNSELQGQLEVAQHNLKILTDQQKLYYQDLEQQITQLQQNKKTKAQKTQVSDNSKNTASPTGFVKNPPENKDDSADATANSDDDEHYLAQSSQPVAASPVVKKIPSLSDADSYDKAFRSLSNKHFTAAQTNFHQYLADYPKGRFAVNAHFWLGEIALMHEKYPVALKQFQTVVAQYPKSTKVSDAKLKIAMIHAATGKMELARNEFKQIQKSYPGTTAAQLASIRLQQLANATSVSVQ